MNKHITSFIWLDWLHREDADSEMLFLNMRFAKQLNTSDKNAETAFQDLTLPVLPINPSEKHKQIREVSIHIFSIQFSNTEKKKIIKHTTNAFQNSWNKKNKTNQIFKKKRVNLRIENKVEYERAVIDIGEDVLMEYGPKIREDARQERFDWAVKQRELKGTYPDNFDDYYAEKWAAEHPEAANKQEGIFYGFIFYFFSQLM